MFYCCVMTVLREQPIMYCLELCSSLKGILKNLAEEGGLSPHHTHYYYVPTSVSLWLSLATLGPHCKNKPLSTKQKQQCSGTKSKSSDRIGVEKQNTPAHIHIEIQLMALTVHYSLNMPHYISCACLFTIPTNGNILQ